ncbi:hypothetical protein COF52_25550 [Bacillus pseudomycoides]|nr:hypothetical protein COF52_25550 [Bacillus pseudomycoides]
MSGCSLPPKKKGFMSSFKLYVDSEDIGLPYFLLYNSILFFQHITRCYEKLKVTRTRFLALFSLGMEHEEGLTASTHERMLSST